MKDTFWKAVSWLRQRVWWVIGMAVGLILVVVGPTFYARYSTVGERYDATAIQEVPQRKVAIVFGAGVLSTGEPTAYLKRRIQTAADLYRAKKAQIILLSGDNSTSHYNEPIAMERYAVKQGIDPKDIVLDYAGFNTYDSCYRAHAIFGVEEAIVITQGYHLPRAMLTCSGVGIRTVGVAAKRTGRDFAATYILRELISTDKAVFQIAFKPKPTALGDPQPIK